MHKRPRVHLRGGDIPIVSQDERDNPITNNDKHIYYDAVLDNQSNTPINCSFSEERTEPLLDNPRDYHVSVVECFLPLINVPLFLWSTLPTPFLITLVYNNVSYQVQPTFKAADNDPLQPVYYYQQALDSFNAALLLSFNNLKAANPGLIGATVLPPFILYDPSNQLFGLVGDSTVFAPGKPTSTGVQIYMNNALYNLFNTLPAFHFGDGLATGLDYQLLIEDMNGTNTYSHSFEGLTVLNATQPNLRLMTTELGTLFGWDDVMKIRVMATALNVVQRFVLSKNGTNERQPVLFEYTPAKDNVSNPRTANAIQYVPLGPYEMVDLDGGSPLKRLDINVYWQSKTGAVFLVKIPPYSFFSIRLLFSRKKTNV